MNNNIIMVANYTSDDSYAWWLMEHFWCILAEEVNKYGGKTFVAYPKLSAASENVNKSSAAALEIKVDKVTEEL